MHDRHRHRETLAETAQGLRRQADFRHQYQHLPASRQYRRHRLQIHFGFAAAGDAVQQERLKPAGLIDRLDRQTLFRTGAQSRLGQDIRWQRRYLRQVLLALRPLLLPQGLERRARYRQRFQHGRGEAVRVFGQQGQGFLLAWSPLQAVRRHVPAAVGDAPAYLGVRPCRLPLAQQCWQHEIQYFAKGMVIVAGGPFAQGVEPLIDDRRFVEYSFDRLEGLQAAGLMSVDHAHQGPFAERHFHPGPTGRHRHLRWQGIVKTAWQGDRQGNL